MPKTTQSTPIYCLTYVSTINTTQLLKRRVFGDIRDEAIAFNRQHGISGFLCYGSRNFFQYIEGEKSVIQSLYAKIQQDPRHHNIKLLSEGEIKTRRCQNWHMNFVTAKALINHHPVAKVYYPFKPHQWHDDKVAHFTEFCISQYNDKTIQVNDYYANFEQTIKLTASTHQAFILLQVSLMLLAVVAFGLIYMFKLNAVFG